MGEEPTPAAWMAVDEENETKCLFETRKMAEHLAKVHDGFVVKPLYVEADTDG